MGWLVACVLVIILVFALAYAGAAIYMVTMEWANARAHGAISAKISSGRQGLMTLTGAAVATSSNIAGMSNAFAASNAALMQQIVSLSNLAVQLRSNVGQASMAMTSAWANLNSQSRAQVATAGATVDSIRVAASGLADQLLQVKRQLAMSAAGGSKASTDRQTLLDQLSASALLTEVQVASSNISAVDLPALVGQYKELDALLPNISASNAAYISQQLAGLAPASMLATMEQEYAGMQADDQGRLASLETAYQSLPYVMSNVATCGTASTSLATLEQQIALDAASKTARISANRVCLVSQQSKTPVCVDPTELSALIAAAKKQQPQPTATTTAAV